MTKKYFGIWDNEREYPLIKSEGYYDGFTVDNLEAVEISKLDIICAAYSSEGYEGDCFVLFRKDGKLYEVNDSHCSCNGLEGWSPEETTKEALLKRSSEYGVWSHHDKELKEIINSLED
jgi:hypothetical protein